MRVGLIIPPSGFMLDERVFPSLGVLKVAAAVRMFGHDVSVLDLSGQPDTADAVEAWVGLGGHSVYGITATTPQMPAAAAIAQVIRDIRPSARIVLGGPHVTLTAAAAKRETIPGRASWALLELKQRFDILVAGDGERAMMEALETGYRRGGLIDADDPASYRFLAPSELDVLPLPARDLIDLPSYRFQIDGHPAVSLIGQLGCPFECGFCGGRMSPTFRRVRLRKAENVVAEMRHLHEAYGARGFMFLDDELNVNKGLVDLCRQITALQADLGTTFACRGLLKAELFTDGQAAALVEAGFRQLLIGFESGSPRILTNINKKATRDENTRAVAIARRHGLKVKALMSIGHPGESATTVEETADWLVEVSPDEFDVTIITVYPGTPYYDHAVQTDTDVWTYTARKTGDKLYAHSINQFVDTPYYKGIPGQYQSFVWTDHLSGDELVALRDETEATIRATLGIPWPSGAAALQYEHSMGQR